MLLHTPADQPLLQMLPMLLLFARILPLLLGKPGVEPGTPLLDGELEGMLGKMVAFKLRKYDVHTGPLPLSLSLWVFLIQLDRKRFQSGMRAF